MLGERITLHPDTGMGALGLKAQATVTDTANIERLLPDLVARYTRTLERLPEIITCDVTRGRAALASNIGPLTVKATETEIQFFRETGHAEAALLQAVGGTSFCGSGGRIWVVPPVPQSARLK